VRRFRGNIKIPHMGWNTIRITGRDGTRCPLFRGIGDGAYFYFVHSYYPAPDEAEVIAAVTDYGGEFASAVWRDNIIATQFHPEKSQRLGLKLIKNFIDVVRGKG
jgi:glutamine amidotransferase